MTFPDVPVAPTRYDEPPSDVVTYEHEPFDSVNDPFDGPCTVRSWFKAVSTHAVAAARAFGDWSSKVFERIESSTEVA